jgi:peptidoglycan hydrolase-like protein with peptidoglycan-binding domain
LQTFLIAQGFYTGKIDGVYSAKTTAAVYAFQQKYTLISDVDALALRGYLGPKTRDKINELMN